MFCLCKYHKSRYNKEEVNKEGVINVSIPVQNEWKEVLEEIRENKDYQQLKLFLKEEYNNQIIYPRKEDIWTAFEWTDYSDVKVVILGQDPYHGEGQAHGLSFSVQPHVQVPPSLKNIYKELETDLGIEPVQHGYLKLWAIQGVFLLNTVLTVRSGQANSHRGKGWEKVTDFVIASLNNRKESIVFILWGAAAYKKKTLIDTSKHFILHSVHPSPLSAYRGFFGSKPFSKANELLVNDGQEPIDWQLPKYK